MAPIPSPKELYDSADKQDGTRILRDPRPQGMLSGMSNVAEQLFDELMKLPASERRTIALRVLQTTDAQRSVSDPRKAVASWESWERAQGVVQFGGNAVEDCDRLYDGT